MMDPRTTEGRTPAAIEADQVVWRQRKDQFVEHLAGATERQAALKAALGALVASPDIDERALKNSRAQRVGLAAELEEIEAGLAVAEGRLLELETELRAAEQRVREQGAVDLVDHALAAARDLDAAWTPAIARLLDVFKAQREAADALDRLRPGHRFLIADATLLRILLHRVPEFGFVDVSERRSAEAYLTSHYARTRQELVNGGATQEPPQEAPAGGPKAEVPRPRTARPGERDSEMCSETCGEPWHCDGDVCEVGRKRTARVDIQPRTPGARA